MSISVFLPFRRTFAHKKVREKVKGGGNDKRATLGLAACENVAVAGRSALEKYAAQKSSQPANPETSQ